MSIKYYEEHDVCFWKKTFDGGDYSIEKPTFAWQDWGLIPNSRPYISTPKANYTIAQVPDSSNRINITEYMPGGMTYESRTGEWQFAIDNTNELWKDWYKGYYEIENYFHGNRFLVSLNDDPEKIYEGRIAISSYEAGDNYSSVTLSYDLDAMPIDESEKTGMIFRVRWLSYTDKIIHTEYFAYDEIPSFYFVDEHLAYPDNSVEKGFLPEIARLHYNLDFKPRYYYKVKQGSSQSVPASNAIVNNALSSHPIQYIIEEPEEKTEETYEVPDTVKFLFNNVKYSIDVMGAGGTTQKRLWYTPDNLGIETTE